MTRSQIDLDDAVAEFFDLWSAETADELHRRLVLQQPIRASADDLEPYLLLSKHHEREPDTSVVTAMLLVTDRRWRKGVHRLVRRVAEAGEIKADDLDMLARTFIAADDHVYWQVPESWWDDGSVVREIEIAEDDVGDDIDDAASDGAVAARRVHAPLRRWAATHLVAGDPNVWSALYARARDRGGVDGAAIMDGLLDGLDDLPDAVQALIVNAAVGWPKAGVRRHALQRLADTGSGEMAHDRAAKDTSARIREWATTLAETATAEDPPDPAQESLF